MQVRFLSLALLLLFQIPVFAGETSKPYDESADAKQEVKAAFAKAKADGKYVLLDFGANWCPDCRILSIFFEDPSIKPLLDTKYHVVAINTGRNNKEPGQDLERNRDLVQQYGNPIAKGIPAVVILKPDGTEVTSTKEGSLANARTMKKEEVLGFLTKWAKQ